MLDTKSTFFSKNAVCVKLTGEQLSPFCTFKFLSCGLMFYSSLVLLLLSQIVTTYPSCSNLSEKNGVLVPNLKDQLYITTSTERERGRKSELFLPKDEIDVNWIGYWISTRLEKGNRLKQCV